MQRERTCGLLSEAVFGWIRCAAKEMERRRRFQLDVRCSFTRLTSNITLKSRKPEEIDMSNNTSARSEAASKTPKAGAVDMKFEIVVIPVSDVDRAKRF